MEDEKVKKEIAALRADIVRVKGEIARSGAAEKAKLDAELGKMNERLRTALEHAKQRSEREEKAARGEVHTLEEKGAKARGEARAAIKADVTKIRKRLKKST